MYRAVVLTTLVLLLLAVVGVSVAQESRTSAAGPNSDDPPASTTPERTSFGATGSEDTTPTPLPGASSEKEDREDASEPTVEEPRKPTAAVPNRKSPTSSSNGVGKPDDSGRGLGKPEHAGKALDVGEPRVEAGHHGKPEQRGNGEEPSRGVGRQKVILCHKNKHTLTVGAPAEAAHLRHDDSLGACR